MGILEVARQFAEEEAEKRGLLQGTIKGKREGVLETQTSIAKKMKTEGVSKSLIAKFTGLSLQQISVL